MNCIIVSVCDRLVKKTTCRKDKVLILCRHGKEEEMQKSLHGMLDVSLCLFFSGFHYLFTLIWIPIALLLRFVVWARVPIGTFVVILSGYGLYVTPMLVQNGGGHCIADERKYDYHTDYLWGYISFVPWKHTVFCGIDPPVQHIGNQDFDRWVTIGESSLTGRYAPKPIPLPGQWQVSSTVVKTMWWDVRLHYVAFTTKGMRHGRIGWRWDDIDEFFLPSLVIMKNLPYNWERIMIYRYVC